MRKTFRDGTAIEVAKNDDNTYGIVVIGKALPPYKLFTLHETEADANDFLVKLYEAFKDKH